jgi:hypothetical protein
MSLDAIPAKLLTRSNPKLAKGEKIGILSAVMHFAPHKLSGANVCPHATDGCAAACLNTAGRGGIGLDENGLNTIQIARIRRTRFFRSNRTAFFDMLAKEIRAHVRYAAKHGFTPAIRLNGTSDIPWEKMPYGDYANIFAAFPNVQFYDYTKWPIRLRGTIPANYNLTFSLAEGNDSHAADALARGVNVAAVFRIPKNVDTPTRYRFRGKVYPVIDGDETDVRFADAGGSIIALRAKGRAKSDTSGFVRDL